MKVNIVLNDEERQELNRYKSENVKLHKKLKHLQHLLASCSELFERSFSSNDSSPCRSKYVKKSKKIGVRKPQVKTAKKRPSMSPSNKLTNVVNQNSSEETDYNTSTDYNDERNVTSSVLNSTVWSNNDEMRETPKDCDVEMEYLQDNKSDTEHLHEMMNQTHLSTPMFENQMNMVDSRFPDGFPAINNSFRALSNHFPIVGATGTPLQKPPGECKFFNRNRTCYTHCVIIIVIVPRLTALNEMCRGA